MGKRSRSDDSESGSESESTSDEGSTGPELKRRAVGASGASSSIDFAALPKSLDEEISDPTELLGILTPSIQTKLLHKLLEDETLKPAVLKVLNGLLTEAMLTYTAKVTKKAEYAASGLATRISHREAKMIDFSAYPKAVEPYLKDVALVARLPVKGSAKAAFELLLTLVRESVPSSENAYCDWGRDCFDKTADAMMAVLARRRREEEGKRWKYREVLEELKYTLKDMEDELGLEFKYPWMGATVALLESWAEGDAKKESS
ncbi:hypothetical protein C8Q73DRAFT_791566 [Cubamyces lactineus]|nr:hypothetical protein C8Q73DRAFT_791566 [Cubamyces lactineus]